MLISNPPPAGDIPGPGDQFGTGAFDDSGRLQPGEYFLTTFCTAGSVILAGANQGSGSAGASFDFTLTFTP